MELPYNHVFIENQEYDTKTIKHSFKRFAKTQFSEVYTPSIDEIDEIDPFPSTIITNVRFVWIHL